MNKAPPGVRGRGGRAKPRVLRGWCGGSRGGPCERGFLLECGRLRKAVRDVTAGHVYRAKPEILNKTQQKPPEEGFVTDLWLPEAFKSWKGNQKHKYSGFKRGLASPLPPCLLFGCFVYITFRDDPHGCGHCCTKKISPAFFNHIIAFPLSRSHSIQGGKTLQTNTLLLTQVVNNTGARKRNRHDPFQVLYVPSTNTCAASAYFYSMET